MEVMLVVLAWAAQPRALPSDDTSLTSSADRATVPRQDQQSNTPSNL